MVQDLNNWNINSEHGNNHKDPHMPKLTQQLKQQLKEELEGIPPIKNLEELEKLKEIYNIDTRRNKIRNDQEYEYHDYSNWWNNINWLFYTFIENSLYIWLFNNGKFEEWVIYYWNNTSWANNKWVMYAIGNFKDWVLSEWIYLYKDNKAERVHSNGDREIWNINGSREILYSNGDSAHYNDRWNLSKIQLNS